MKIFSILEPATKEAIDLFIQKRKLPLDYIKKSHHPQEDYLFYSDNPPLAVVADGVTLNVEKLVEQRRAYPVPSPAGEVAKIFCQSAADIIKQKYEQFSFDDLDDVFRIANQAVARYNKQVGKSEIAGNITGFYAATGAFVIIKEKQAFWAAICDSFVAHFDKQMNLRFISSGNCSPYAVINGEEKMEQYLEKGIFDLEKGDYIFVFTDGFEHYVRHPEFQKIFLDFDHELSGRIKQFSQLMNSKDPTKFGHERSLVVMRI